MLGISDYSSKQTSSPAKETASMAKEHDKTNVVLTRFFFFCISCSLSHMPSFQYNNELLSELAGRAAGDTVVMRLSEKYIFPKNSHNSQENRCDGLLF